MTVSAEVAPYFKRRKLIANQVIEKELEYGGLIISAKVGHANLLTPASAAFWSAIKTAEARAKKKGDGG